MEKLKVPRPLDKRKNRERPRLNIRNFVGPVSVAVMLVLAGASAVHAEEEWIDGFYRFTSSGEDHRSGECRNGLMFDCHLGTRCEMGITIGENGENYDEAAKNLCRGVMEQEDGKEETE